MNFVSCVKWVKQGAAQSTPENVNLNEDELRILVNDLENKTVDGEVSTKVHSSEDEYDFKNYDEEDGSLRASLKGIVSFDEHSSKKKSGKSKLKKRIRHDSTSDSEKEDETIKTDDNLLLVGHVDDDLSTIDIYVFNKNDGDMYIHHDLMLQSPPLCVEWLSVDTASGPGNMCVVGTMNPVVEIWDLDMINCVEPTSKLGRSKEKNAHKNFGHTDAVLCVAWNLELPHILCSGSVDKRALLWDLDNGKVATEINVFNEKVQALTWNPQSPFHLLTACADGYLRNFDCRGYNQFQKFNLKSSVESITWSHENEFICFAGTEEGNIYHLDFRFEKPVRSFQAHSKEITGLAVNKISPNILISISTDECMKLWNVNQASSELLHVKDLKLEALHCIDMNPDYPYLACIGGSLGSSNKKILKVVNVDDILTPKPLSQEHYSSDVVPNNIPLLENHSNRENKPNEKQMKVKKKKFKKNFTKKNKKF